MKKVLSISLGSSKRDHRVKTSFLGQEFLIERRGTDGDKKQAAALFSRLDGKYDAFGLGGIDLYIQSGGRCYTFRDAKKLIKNVKKTPVVDGTGLKNTLERRVIDYLDQEQGMQLTGKKVLLVSGVDRFGMAEALVNRGCKVIFGDVMFSLKLPIPLRSLKALSLLALVAAPIITKLPFEMLYPLGKNQDSGITGKFERYYREAEIVAGDFHYIKRYLPTRMDDKLIITNTVTADDVENLRQLGVKQIITTTPNMEGRSFGTNVMEAVLVALSEKRPDKLEVTDYNNLLDKLGFSPRIIDFKE